MLHKLWHKSWHCSFPSQYPPYVSFCILWAHDGNDDEDDDVVDVDDDDVDVDGDDVDVDDDDVDAHRSSDILHLLLGDHPISIQVIEIKSPPASLLSLHCIPVIDL